MSKTNFPDETPLANAVMLPRARIRANPDQPRRHFDETALRELADSLREHGMMAPLTVRYAPARYDGTPYVLVSGERRFRASEDILDTVPCLISDVPAARARELALIENIQREDLTAMEEARALAELIKSRELSARRAAKTLGVSEGWVTNRLSLLKTRADVQEVAARVPAAMSSLLLIDAVCGDATLRRELLESVTAGAPHSHIKKRIEAFRDAEKLSRETAKAPDAQTQQRSARHAQTGGGNISRGAEITGTSPREARREFERLLAEAEATALLLKQWAPHLDAKAHAALEPRIRHLRAEIGRLTS